MWKRGSLSLTPIRFFRIDLLPYSTRLTGSKPAIIRTLSDAITVLLAENFDGFVVEGDASLAVEQAINARQHFPSLEIVCLVPPTNEGKHTQIATQQNLKIIYAHTSDRRLDFHLREFVRALDRQAGARQKESIPAIL